MNNIGQLSLFDFLSILLVGFLIVVPFYNPAIPDSFIYSTFVMLVSYVVGLCYHRIIEALYSCLGLRNNKCMIDKAYKDVCKEFPTACIMENSKESYYDKYYLLMQKGCLGSIPILEAQLAFMRNIIPILAAYVGLLLAGCSKVCALVHNLFGCGSQCIVAVILTVFFFVLIMMLYSVQLKIHKLVWEGGYFVGIRDNKSKSHE